MAPADELLAIPGVGPKISKKLNRLGIFSMHDLVDREAQQLYDQLNHLEGRRVDRCVLYVFRLAVAFARDEIHDPDLLSWWKWKD